MRVAGLVVLVHLLTVGGLSSALGHRPKGMPDLPPDASTAQVLREFSGARFSVFSERNPLARTVIDDVIDLGARNLEWLKYINSHRPANDQISLTSKQTASGYPIDSPTVYSPKIVQERLDKLRTDIPPEMREVLFNNKAFTEDLPLEKDKFIEWGRNTDKLYQTAVRWRGMEPWLGELEQNRANDVRGIYYLNKMDPAVRSAKLSQPAQWTSAEKTDFTGWLVSLCLNNESDLVACRTQVTHEVNAGHSVLPLYDSWKATSQTLWDGFFTIENARPDIHIVNPDLLEMPFRDPNDATVRSFLTDNIEDEWRFGTWMLKMVYSATAAAQVVFQPGVTPHVNGLGGNIITMNSDQPLTEYDAQWTIRHEFGHVIGFPDCYVEFYDADIPAIVSYQLDVTNLMCSRQGHIQQKHVDELLRAYQTVQPRS